MYYRSHYIISYLKKINYITLLNYIISKQLVCVLLKVILNGYLYGSLSIVRHIDRPTYR